MRIRRQRVGAPQQHEVALRNPLGVGADVRADRHPHPDRARHRADRAVEPRRAELVEEAPIHRRALEQAHRAGVGVRQDRLRPVARLGDRVQPVGDLAQRVVPRDRLEAAASLGADPPQRRAQSVVMVRALDVSIHLGAEEAARERVVGIAGDPHRAPVFDGDEHRAGVGAVVRTRASHHAIQSASRVCASGPMGEVIVEASVFPT